MRMFYGIYCTVFETDNKGWRYEGGFIRVAVSSEVHFLPNAHDMDIGSDCIKTIS